MLRDDIFILESSRWQEQATDSFASPFPQAHERPELPRQHCPFSTTSVIKWGTVRESGRPRRGAHLQAVPLLRADYRGRPHFRRCHSDKYVPVLPVYFKHSAFVPYPDSVKTCAMGSQFPCLFCCTSGLYLVNNTEGWKERGPLFHVHNPAVT